MNWEMIFGIANTAVLPFWLLLALAPRREIVMRIIFFGGCGLLSLTYAILMLGLLSGGLHDGGTGGGAAADFSTLAGIMAIFASPGGATVGWIHYLAFDLFVGIWVARNADARDIGRGWQILILFLCLMAGPLGLLLYLIFRHFAGNKQPKDLVPR